MSQQPDIKLVQINHVVVPRPYTDTTYQITEGVYATETIKQLFGALQSVYAKQGLEVMSIKPVEITLREYHDNTGSDQSGKEVPERGDDRQPADE
jgi:hypothetical protein